LVFVDARSPAQSLYRRIRPALVNASALRVLRNNPSSTSCAEIMTRVHTRRFKWVVGNPRFPAFFFRKWRIAADSFAKPLTEGLPFFLPRSSHNERRCASCFCTSLPTRQGCWRQFSPYTNQHVHHRGHPRRPQLADFHLILPSSASQPNSSSGESAYKRRFRHTRPTAMNHRAGCRRERVCLAHRLHASHDARTMIFCSA